MEFGQIVKFDMQHISIFTFIDHRFGILANSHVSSMKKLKIMCWICFVVVIDHFCLQDICDLPENEALTEASPVDVTSLEVCDTTEIFHASSLSDSAGKSLQSCTSCKHHIHNAGDFSGITGNGAAAVAVSNDGVQKNSKELNKAKKREDKGIGE